MAEKSKINGLDRKVWNKTIKEIATSLHDLPEATDEQKKTAMVAFYGPMNYSDSLIIKLLATAETYSVVMRYFSENYFRLWCTVLENREIVENIVKMFRENAWMVKGVKNSLFAKSLIHNQVRAMVKAQVSYKDIPAYQADRKAFTTQRVKKIIGYNVRKEVFIHFCTEINFQLGQLIVAELKRQKKVWAQARVRGEGRKRLAGLSKEAEKAKAVVDAKNLKAILVGEKVKLEGGKYAFCCDLEKAKLLDPGALIYSGDVIYRRAKKGIEETKLRLREDVKEAVKAKRKPALPENLPEVWVTLESSKGNQIFKVTIVPVGFTKSSSEVLKRFKKEQRFAFQEGEIYHVWQMAKVAHCVGDCRKATKEESLVAKGEKGSIQSGCFG